MNDATQRPLHRPGPPLLRVRRLGLQPYQPVWQAMSDFTDRRGADTPDELWLLEHEPVFTLGQAGRPEHVLAPGAIPVVNSNRGGQVTYHGPGQIVGYPLFDLRRLRIGVRDFVTAIEQAMIDAMAQWGIHATRHEGAPGVYVGEAKIGALGIRVRHGCAFHGLALNVNMNLEPFQRINPCGYKGLAVTQMIDLGGPPRLRDVEDALVGAFARGFGFHLQTAPPDCLDAAASGMHARTTP
ncbi:MAG TPA: lipoyl(octanoyl) transferase LipB [Rhodanobacteraceae bacterium]|nr:lipoyl(octanoyl) transferase LipB [Rhodanobacteraceae bacterium]